MLRVYAPGPRPSAPGVVQQFEVLCVVRQQDAPLLRGYRQDLVVTRALRMKLPQGDNVVPCLAEHPANEGFDVVIEEKG